MSIQLSDQERVARTARQHWIIFIPAVTGAVIAFVAGVVALALLPNDVSGKSITQLKVLCLLVLVLALPLWLAWRWLTWRSTVYVITNRRVIKHHGVLNRITTSISLERVTDQWLYQGIISHFVNIGDIIIQSAGKDGTEKLRWIYDPEGFLNEFLVQFEWRMYPTRDPTFYPANPAASGLPPEPPREPPAALPNPDPGGT